MIALQSRKQRIANVQFSSDGQWLLAAGMPGELRVWNVHGGRSRMLRRSVYAGGELATFTPDSTSVVAVVHPHILKFPIKRGPEELLLQSGADQFLSCVGFGRRRRELLLTEIRGRRGRFFNWSLEAQAKTWEMQLAEQTIPFIGVASRDGSKIAVLTGTPDVRIGDANRPIETWDVLTRTPLLTPRLCLSPGEQLLAWTVAQRAFVWDIQARKQVASLPHGRRHVTSLAFHPAEPLIATGCNDGSVRFWSTQMWKQIRTFDWHSDPIQSVAFSDDGMLAACGGKRGQIVVWDVDF